MASKSPGKAAKRKDQFRDDGDDDDRKSDAGSVGSARSNRSNASKKGSLSKGASALASRVRSSLFGSGKRSKSKDRQQQGDEDARSGASSREGTRIEIGYYGKRTDARDRSSEDPRRHSIPRASVTPTRGGSRAGTPTTTEQHEDGGTPTVPPRPRSKLRKKSLERELG